MGITDAQRDRRRTGIGSSDVAALFGLDPFKNERDVYIEKTLTLKEAEPNEAMQIGNMFEDPLIQWTSQVLDKPVRKNQARRCGVMLAHLDAIIVGEPEHIEAKTTGNREGWEQTSIDNPSNGVPARVVLQAHHQMICADTETVWVPVLIPGFMALERKLYRIDKDPELCDMVQSRCESWWQDHVSAGIEPNPDQFPPPSRQVLNRIARDPGAWARLDSALVEAYINAQQAFLLSKKAKELAEAQVIAALGTAEGGCAENEDLPQITYFESPGRTSYGTGSKYEDKCDSCGVGKKVGNPYRTLRKRKRRGV